MLKICIDCKESKNIELFVKDKRKPDGYTNRCKKCENLRRRKTPIKPIAKEGYKYCSKCNKEFPLNNFNIRTVKGKKTYFSWCKPCEWEYNNNKYTHTCCSCGKTYKSGNKNSRICRDCHSIEFSKIGKATLAKFNRSGTNNGMYGVHRFGKDNPNYKIDKTEEERNYGRLLEGYGLWRDSVYKRDNYICKCCGYDKGGNLNAHHLDGYSWCKEKRTDIDNGVTLCDKCHKEFHSIYGYFNNTKEQFIDFMKSKSVLK